MTPIQRDQCFGRRLARMGAARIVITRDTDHVPTKTERALFWRQRSGNPGLGNVVFLRQPVRDCPQPESPFKPIEYVPQTPAAAAAAHGASDGAPDGQVVAPGDDAVPGVSSFAADATRQHSPTGEPHDAEPAGVSAAGNPIQSKETP